MVDKTAPREIDDRGGVYDPNTGEHDPRTDAGVQQITLSLADLSAFVDQKVAEALAAAAVAHEDVLAEMRKLIPDHTVPMHAGGPGIAKAQSWSLAQQEASSRGEYVE